MKSRKVLYADDGMFLTDGKTIGKIIFLGADRPESDFREITEAESEQLQAQWDAEAEEAV